MALSFGEVRQYSNRKITAALVAIGIVALVASASVMYFLHMVLKIRQESIQITKVQMSLDAYYMALLEAENSQREYLITGDEGRLQRYQQMVVQLPEKGRQLQAVSAHARYATKVAQLQAVATDRMVALGAGVVARRDQGEEAAEEVVRQGRGLRDMIAIQGLMQEIGQQQATELAAKRELATRYGSWTYLIAGLMLAAIGMLAAVVYYLFLHAIKAERALDRAKDEFVSLASHQLRTPATGVKAILSLLRSGDAGELTKRQQHLVNRAMESNERGLRIVEELLNVARADAGRLVLRLAAVDVRAVIESAAQEQRRLVEAKRQRLTIQTPKRPVRMMVDEEKIHMAVSNLIDNASKYTPEGGVIRIQLRDQPKAVSIAVNDNGIGIEKAELGTIFDRFQRAHGMLMNGVEGTGLGLYLARRIIELHHGTIEVDSREGEGSTFTLVLPRKGRANVA